MTTIIGVDFSGQRDDRNTWIAQGRLDAAGALHLDSAQPIRRADLYGVMLDVPTPAVAALDFPFGAPRHFAARLAAGNALGAMAEVWPLVAGMTGAEFICHRNRFVAAHGEPKRAGDAKHHPESYSPLHSVNPNMLPMTYEGIGLLHRWHQAQPRRWHVPPLAAGSSPAETVTLLELMPGAFLKAIGLPYKGYKRGRQSLERRTAILDGLASAAGVSLPNLSAVRFACRANDDCLDAVVAAVGAAAWARNPARFRHPTDDELPDAMLEGWIYVPATATPAPSPGRRPPAASR